MRWRKPPIHVELVEDRTPEQPPGFLRLRRRLLRNRYADGSASPDYEYDAADRRATDAVVLVLHTDDDRVLLRTSLRPPLAFREELAVPVDPRVDPVLWELPAGLVEPEERGEEGLRLCCARETLEETGFTLDPSAFVPMGAPIFLSPGVIAERLYYFTAKVEESARGIPTEDGTPVESGSTVRFFTIDEAIAGCDAGEIGDVKSEVGLRRLAARGRTR
ncbi:MAG: NUDIX hydrolase [Sandaracinus sp.]|nr:NUDIX hydrolase [Myxococcales bacterium]MCB9602898.1 NUDIX hydrolase [Sandaracinus sp.]MCB9620552.1 NUDIX hydrolase [Sandaracinus sp.]MCB9631389.1 NUDIX hydrolase [Sandaracinus sp.]